jgi:nucleotide-sensitive chloride channel 1A
MSIEVIHDAPRPDSFTPLAVHQSQTPDSFFTGSPVLHYHATGARAIISNSQIELQSIFSRETPVTRDTIVNGHTSPLEGTLANGTGNRQQILSDIDVLVTSE